MAGLERLLPGMALLLASCTAVPIAEFESFATPPPRATTPPRATSKPPREASLRSQPDVSAFVEGRPLRAPSGYLVFCAENPADCQGTARRDVNWSAGTRATVETINASINRSITPANEAFEDWSAETSRGDCEDYVLKKQRVLIRAGLPASALRVAVATTPTGELHAVLVVRTSDGDFVLDNRNDTVLRPNATDLRWIKMASAENPRVWHVIEPSSTRT